MVFVGRSTELNHLADRLRSRRLVTVIGPGGIGKTTLARAAAARMAGTFEHGVLEIDLTRIDDDDEVEHALAGQLGFPSFAALLDSPTDQPALLLIDNCEHVVDAVAGAVGRLLAACAAPTVLATSRAPLDLPDESLVVLGPLEVPAPEQIDADVPAVRLFLDRATDAGSVFDADQLSTVCELVRRLDGVPLALDIAAARTRSMSLDEILHRFGNDDLSVFDRPRYRGAARHRSLRAAIEWSYELLTMDDQQFFDRLGVFRGPFTIEMARSVAGESTLEATQARMEALIDASLVTAETIGTVTWYRLMATLRSFASERLNERDVLASTMERFVDHAVQAGRELIEQSKPAWPAELLLRLLAFHDNLAAATRWCLDHDDAPDRAFVALTAMWGVIHQSRAAEVEQLGGRVIDRWPDRDAPGWADAAATIATARFIMGRLDDAEHLVHEALPVADRSTFAPVTLRRVLGQIRQARGEASSSLDSFDEAVREARRRSFDALAMESIVFGAVLLADLGNVEEALARLDDVRNEAEQAGSDISWIWAATADAYVRLRVDPREAIPAIETCLELARGAGYPAGVSSNLRSLALAHLLLDDLGTAAAVTLDLLEETARRGAVDELREALSLSSVVADRCRDERSADLAATARSLPSVSLLASVGNEILPLPTGAGTALPVREAVHQARSLLRAQLDTADRSVAPHDVRADDLPTKPSLRQVGELWEVYFDDRTALLRPSKGIQDLARLLAEPHREIHCLDLMGAAVVASDTGTLIDDDARRQYEQRIRDLQEQIDEAEADHDLVRAERATAELDLLVEHLTAAMGRGGANRRSGDTAERARSAVTQRIRNSIRRIGEALPALGGHLDASVQTGVYCSYRPESAVDWEL